MDVISSILELPKQCRQAWEEASQIKLSLDWKIDNVVVCGMGGSALGAHILQTNGSLDVPLIINNNYLLPSWADEKSLVVLASYSGVTAEVLSCAQNAKEKKCKVIGITSGGKLAKWLGENNCPAYIFDPKYNATKQPRLGVGYNLFGLAALLANLKLFNANYTDDIAENAIRNLKEKSKEIQQEAEKFAQSLKDKIPTIFAADYLVGNAHIFANQLNETAKTFSAWFAIPEANHHLLEGLKHPEFPAAAVFLGSNYPAKIIKRMEITREILEKNGWEVLWYKPGQEDSFALSVQTLYFSSLVSAYLGLEYKEDPVNSPTVDYFKSKLG